MLSFIIRTVLVLLTVVLAGELMTWLNVDAVYPLIATLFASIFFFFRDFLTGSGFVVRHHMVSTGTPEKFCCWLAAFGWSSALVVMFIDVLQ